MGCHALSSAYRQLQKPPARQRERPHARSHARSRQCRTDEQALLPPRARQTAGASLPSAAVAVAVYMSAGTERAGTARAGTAHLQQRVRVERVALQERHQRVGIVGRHCGLERRLRRPVQLPVLESEVGAACPRRVNFTARAAAEQACAPASLVSTGSHWIMYSPPSSLDGGRDHVASGATRLLLRSGARGRATLVSAVSEPAGSRGGRHAHAHCLPRRPMARISPCRSTCAARTTSAPKCLRSSFSSLSDLRAVSCCCCCHHTACATQSCLLGVSGQQA